MFEDEGVSVLDEIDQIGAVFEYVDEKTGEIKHGYKMGTKEFFSGSEYPVRVFRLTPDQDFMIHFPDYRFAVRASDSKEVLLYIVSFRSYYFVHKAS